MRPGSGRTTWRRPGSSSGPGRGAARAQTPRPQLVTTSEEAARTLVIGPGHVDPADIELAVAVDAFDFAMEVTRSADGLRLDRVAPG